MSGKDAIVTPGKPGTQRSDIERPRPIRARRAASPLPAQRPVLTDRRRIGRLPEFSYCVYMTSMKLSWRERLTGAPVSMIACTFTPRRTLLAYSVVLASRPRGSGAVSPL
jgi:hypothetical protein